MDAWTEDRHSLADASLREVGSRMTPEHSSIERRIQRAYVRMMNARSEAWAFAWGDSLYRMVMRRRLEIPALNREFEAGNAARGSQSVTDLGKHFTTELTNGSRRVP
jgi:hypothetical protein